MLQTPRKMPRKTLTIALSVLPIVALINVGVLIYSLGGINLSEKLVRPDLLALVALLVFVPMISNSIRLAIWAKWLGVDLGFRAGANGYVLKDDGQTEFLGAVKNVLAIACGIVVARGLGESARAALVARGDQLAGQGRRRRPALGIVAAPARRSDAARRGPRWS